MRRRGLAVANGGFREARSRSDYIKGEFYGPVRRKLAARSRGEASSACSEQAINCMLRSSG